MPRSARKYLLQKLDFPRVAYQQQSQSNIRSSLPLLSLLEIISFLKLPLNSKPNNNLSDLITTPANARTSNFPNTTSEPSENMISRPQISTAETQFQPQLAESSSRHTRKRYTALYWRVASMHVFLGNPCRCRIWGVG